jgi:hypothetical protein
MNMGHWSTRNRTIAEVPDPLGISGGEKVVDYLQERRRLRAAGFAHVARLAVDGGPVVEPKPIRRRYLLNAAAAVGIGCFALGVVAAILGVVG